MPSPKSYDLECGDCQNVMPNAIVWPDEPKACDKCQSTNTRQLPNVAAGHIWKCGAAEAMPRQHFGTSKKGYSN